MEIDYGDPGMQHHIIERCLEASQSGGVGKVSGSKPSHPVVKLCDKIVVKFGLGVTAGEAYAQNFAYSRLDRSIVRVPRVLQFFTRKQQDFWTIGYLVMENIEGVTFEDLNFVRSSHIIHKLSNALNHLHSFTGTRPGPLDGNEAFGLLWSEHGSGENFNSLDDLENYLNVRLAKVQDRIDIRQTELCLCHLDIASRNLMLDAEGSIYLLDWGAAGFYPRFFERWSIELSIYISGEDPWLEKLLQIIDEPSATDRIQIEKLNHVFALNQRFAL